MSTTTILGRPIPIGFAWTHRLTVTFTPPADPPFPAGSTFRADVREWAGAPDASLSLTSQAGQLVRFSDTELDIVLPGAATALLRPGVAVIDLVRTDVSPDAYSHVTVTVPVKISGTAPAEPS